MEDTGIEKHVVHEKQMDNDKYKRPLIILTGGRVVQHVGEQQKKVKDNCVKNANKLNEA